MTKTWTETMSTIERNLAQGGAGSVDFARAELKRLAKIADHFVEMHGDHRRRDHLVPFDSIEAFRMMRYSGDAPLMQQA